MSVAPEVLARMDKFIDKKSSPDGCWIWTGARTRGGYGNFAIERKAHRVVRIVLHTTLGLDLYGPWVARHICDNPPCCRPDHLLAGTQHQNVNDAVSRGRFAMGTSTNTSKITEKDVLEIRRRAEAGEGSYRIAEDYPVTYEQVRRIIRRKTWAWL